MSVALDGDTIRRSDIVSAGTKFLLDDFRDIWHESVQVPGRFGFRAGSLEYQHGLFSAIHRQTYLLVFCPPAPEDLT